MIYFIEAQGLVKIGHSNDPKRRLQMLSTGCPFPCTLIGVMEGGKDEEQEVHSKFAHLRTKGEWFKLTPEINAYLASHAVHLETAGRTQVDHPLARHLALVGESVSHFSKRVGVSRVHLYRIMDGQNTRMSTLERISSATKGAVSLNDFAEAYQ